MDSKHKVIFKNISQNVQEMFLVFPHLEFIIVLLLPLAVVCLFASFFSVVLGFWRSFLVMLFFSPLSLSLSLRSCVKTLQHLLVCESSVCFVVD
jgi:hypothetical protein